MDAHLRFLGVTTTLAIAWSYLFVFGQTAESGAFYVFPFSAADAAIPGAQIFLWVGVWLLLAYFAKVVLGPLFDLIITWLWRSTLLIAPLGIAWSVWVGRELPLDGFNRVFLVALAAMVLLITLGRIAYRKSGPFFLTDHGGGGPRPLSQLPPPEYFSP
ncbi:MAG: hypothetical protein M0D54_20255 [Hyphomonadaceae bacterium JAD_PAG50586_4]|nr:MAG: hypothetical protein M0D54_20255 [Hyphomonadaceae bacterium JAD_PAG50586_4]